MNSHLRSYLLVCLGALALPAGLTAGATPGPAAELPGARGPAGSQAYSVAQGTPAPTASPTVGTSVSTATASATASATVDATVGASATATASANPGCGVSGPPGPWAPVSPYPFPVEGAAVASDGPNLYTFGGIQVGGVYHDEAYKYTPATNTWMALAGMAAGADYNLAAEYGGNGKIYVMGGAVQLNANRIYDIATNAWALGAPVPSGGWGFAHADYNGKIYLMGGGYNAEPHTAVYAYDVAHNSWSALAPLPQADAGMAAAAINGKIYVANGARGNTLYIYDIAANTWTSGAPSPLASNGPAGVAIDGRLYLIGGSTFPYAVVNHATYLYDPPSDTWAAGPSLQVGRALANAATVTTAKGVVTLVVGGHDDGTNTSLSSVEISTAPGVPCPSATPTATGSPTATSTACPLNFVDTQPSDYFYTPVQYLYCRGVISGYNTNPPCANGTPCFQPYANTTRSQMVKIVVLGFHVPNVTPPPGSYTFQDVPLAQPFFAVIETAAAQGIVSGYACGGPGEPCDLQGRPYFRPYADVTRGQLAKIDVLAAGWLPEQVSVATFADVAPGSAFSAYVEAAVCRGVVSGYDCGSPTEPCGPGNHAYFRPGANATRGQISKIVYLSINNTGGCTPPTPITGGYQVGVFSPHYDCDTTASAGVTLNGAPVAGVAMQAHWLLSDSNGHTTAEDCAAVSGSNGMATCYVVPIPNFEHGSVTLIFTTPDHVTLSASGGANCGGR